MSLPYDIVVVGSLNMDMIMQTPRIPKAGETLIQGIFSTASGGKGANQAVAAARMDANVNMIGCVGKDTFGETLIHNLKQDHINTEHILQVDSNTSGTALVMVEPGGENRIIVAPGANSSLSPDYIDSKAKVIQACKILVLQLETPIETITRAAQIAHKAGVTVILNPGPAQLLSKSLLENVNILIPNLGEAQTLTGKPDCNDPESLTEMLHELGPKTIIITLGSKGIYYSNENHSSLIPPYKVKVVDTTAAGDAFVAGLSAALSKGFDLENAIKWGNAAGALACTTLGAQPSLPETNAVLNLIRS